MTERHVPRVIALVDQRSAGLPIPTAAFAAETRITADGLLTDPVSYTHLTLPTN